MMKFTAVPLALSLLLCTCGAWARGESERGSEVPTETQTTTPADIWTELSDLRDVVLQQRHMVHHLGAIVAEQRAQLHFYKSHIDELKTSTAAHAAELSAMGTEMEELRRQNAGQPKVAFFSALAIDGFVGPFDTETTLAYKDVTNVGEAYSDITGVFTAPVRGVYYFRYTACGQPYSRAIGVRLYKNDQSIMYTSEGSDSDGGLEYVSNAAVLEMEVGDVVYLCLPANLQLFDSSYNRNTFSGFLLFTV